MNTLKKLGFGAATALVLGLGSASAEVVITNGNGDVIDPTNSATGVVLNPGVPNVLNYEDNELVDGQDLAGTEFVFTIGPDVAEMLASFDVEYPNGIGAGIRDFDVSISINDGAASVFNVTNGEGRLDLDASVGEFLVSAGDVITVALAGTAFEVGTDAEYALRFQGFEMNAVPVPAAGLLFGTAALGGALARRRRNAA